MSGEIPSKQLCSMTAEELSSKELSQWQRAKAEELAQMAVLPLAEYFSHGLSHWHLLKGVYFIN